MNLATDTERLIPMQSDLATTAQREKSIGNERFIFLIGNH